VGKFRILTCEFIYIKKEWILEKEISGKLTEGAINVR
jgi:hypothetical protein